MATPFERVLAEPGSRAARRALLEHWRAAGDPRAELMSKQLELAGLNPMSATVRWRTLRQELRDLIATRGRELAGRVADLVSEYRFVGGLVGRVTMTGEQWALHGRDLFTLVPVQQLALIAPFGDFAKAFGVAELERIVVLEAAYAGAAFGDAGAIALARAPAAANLLMIDLEGDAIGDAGVEAMAASPYLERVRYIGLRDNPTDPTPVVDDHDGVRSARCPPIASALEATFGPRPWLAMPDADAAYPPDSDALCMAD